jgi:hypothetical protein
MASGLDGYTDEELGRMLRAASRSNQSAQHEVHTNLDAFCAFLDSVGLGLIANAIKISAWAWERVKGIWRRIFGK